MATLNVIYKIAADISGIEKSATKVANSMGALESGAKKLGAALAGAFTVAAIAGATKQVLDFAGEISDLSAKTGIGTTGLQKLGMAFEQSGISLDTVAKNVTTLQKNLIDGDKSAVSAMNKLGLSASELKAMKPEDAFTKVADAVGNIQNPAEKSYAAMAIFGKGGAELVAGLSGNLQETTDKFEAMGVILDEETVAAADEFGDTLGILMKQGMALIANVLAPFLPLLMMAAQHLVDFAGGIMGFVKPAVEFFIKIMLQASVRIHEFLADILDAVQKIPLLGKHLGIAGTASDFLRERAEKLTGMLEDMNDTTAKVGVTTGKVAAPVLGLGKANEEAAKASEKLWEKLHALEIVNPGLEKGFGLVSDEIEKVKERIEKTNPAIAALEQHAFAANFGMRSLADGLEDVGKNVPNEEIARMSSLMDFVGPKQVEKISAMGQAWESLKDKFNVKGMAEGIGTGFLEGLGGILSGGISSLISKGLGALTSGIGKLFGNTEEKKINPIRQGFIDAAGGLEELNLRAQTAGVTLTALLDAKNPKAYEAAIKDLTKAFEFQDQSMKFLDETVEKYGLTIDQLGPRFSQQKLDEQAATLLKEFRALEGAGVDIGIVSDKMSGSINEYLQNALKTGSTVPLAFREIANELMNQGLLTDDAGNKIEDLEKSGLKFAQTNDEKFGTLLTTIEKLVQAIDRGLGGAIAKLPTEKTIHIKTAYSTVGEPTDVSGLDFGGEMAAGGFGTVTRPTAFIAGEAGPEQFAFSGAGRTFGDVRPAGKAMTTAELEREVRELRSDLRRVLPRSIGLAVKDAMALAR